MIVAATIIGCHFAFVLLLTGVFVAVEMLTKGKCPPLLQWTISLSFTAGIAGLILMKIR